MIKLLLGILLMLGGTIYLGYALYLAYPPLLHIYIAIAAVRVGMVITDKRKL